MPFAFMRLRLSYAIKKFTLLLTWVELGLNVYSIMGPDVAGCTLHVRSQVARRVSIAEVGCMRRLRLRDAEWTSRGHSDVIHTPFKLYPDVKRTTAQRRRCT